MAGTKLEAAWRSKEERRRLGRARATWLVSSLCQHHLLILAPPAVFGFAEERENGRSRQNYDVRTASARRTPTTSARLACMAPLVPPVEEETNGERRFRSCPWAPKTSTPRSDVLARELLHSALIASPPRLCPAPLHILAQIHASPTNTVLLSP
jgi:hypothetical protein